VNNKVIAKLIPFLILVANIIAGAMKKRTQNSNASRLTPFHQCVVDVIRRIPRGKVATYGQIAGLAGDSRAARQVVRILHTQSEKCSLAWHRVINKQGRISLPHHGGYELQKSLLKREGVKFDRDDVIDLTRYGWKPRLR